MKGLIGIKIANLRLTWAIVPLTLAHMKHRTKIKPFAFIASLALCFVLLSACGGDASSDSGGGIVATGRADVTGNVVESSLPGNRGGIAVSIRERKTTTDKSGHFTLLGVLAGDQSLVFSKGGQAVTLGVTIPRNSRVSIADIRIKNGAASTNHVDVQPKPSPSENSDDGGLSNSSKNDDKNDDKNDQNDNSKNDDGGSVSSDASPDDDFGGGSEDDNGGGTDGSNGDGQGDNDSGENQDDNGSGGGSSDDQSGDSGHAPNNEQDDDNDSHQGGDDKKDDEDCESSDPDCQEG